MSAGLPVSNIVNVTVSLQPLAVPNRNFGAGLLVGSSAVIDTSERLRTYSSLDQVVADFANTSDEYKAAALFFGQDPQPSLLYIGRWAQTGTSAVLHGGALSSAQQTLTNFTAITTGSMSITVDGTAKTLSNLNFSSATNLNAVAAVIDTALAGASVKWDAVRGRFDITSDSTGTTSTITYASSTGSGTDVSALLKLTAASGASAPVAGIAAETLLSAVQALADRSQDWYACIPVASGIGNSALLDVAAFIEGASPSRLLGITSQDPLCLDATNSTDIGSLVQAAKYKRTWVQYSSSSPYAAASFFGRASTVNFEAAGTTLTMKFKQEPGVVAETLAASQAAALKAKNVNVFVNYSNSSAIIQEGVMANGYYFDEVQGTDWLQNAIQTDVYNLLFQAPTKVPQTDAGTHLIVNTIEATLARAVNNGLVGPGVWNAPLEFGQLKKGDTLSKGFYVYAPPVATQAQADREARKSVPIQVAVKLQGAVHTVNVAIQVNR